MLGLSKRRGELILHEKKMGWDIMGKKGAAGEGGGVLPRKTLKTGSGFLYLSKS